MSSASKPVVVKKKKKKKRQKYPCLYCPGVAFARPKPFLKHLLEAGHIHLPEDPRPGRVACSACGMTKSHKHKSGGRGRAEASGDSQGQGTQGERPQVKRRRKEEEEARITENQPALLERATKYS